MNPTMVRQTLKWCFVHRHDGPITRTQLRTAIARARILKEFGEW